MISDSIFLLSKIVHTDASGFGGLKWSCFLGQVCGLAKMHLVCVHAAFRVSAFPKYAMSGVRLSRAV